MMAKHIHSIKIHSYRGIHHLELEGLNHINILTGDNNSGKTSVLELISSIDNPQNINTWAGIIRDNRNASLKKYFYNGFYNMFSIDEEKKVIDYEFENESQQKYHIHLQADFEETQISEREMYRINGLMRTGNKKEDDFMIDTKCMHLGTFINEEKVSEEKIFDFQTRISMFIKKESKFVRTIYVSPVAHAFENSYLNSVLSDSELYGEMLDILKEFDENILSINTVYPDEKSQKPEYMVLTKDHKKALPLNVYGDGMKKVILLLSAIVEAKNGILLLDEFETAIHTSAMEHVFSWLLKSAMKLNVQVFLTSHNREAIEKILRCEKEIQENMNLYTLYKLDKRNLVRCMKGKEAILAQDNLGLELR